MKVWSHFICLATLMIAMTMVQGRKRCDKIVTRRDIRDISPLEREKFFNALNKLIRVRKGLASKMAWKHNNMTSIIHGKPVFFPWHRMFIRKFEMALQKIDPEVVLPYWDWTRDSQAPEKSLIFTDEYFGGNGLPENYWCVVDGQIKGLQIDYPKPRCLQRLFDASPKISAFYPAETIELNIRRSIDFRSFTNAIEMGGHMTVHNNIGGEMGSQYSPNDPIFYLHHAFTDLLWREWQARNLKKAKNYSGNPKEILRPFKVSVEKVFNTKRVGLCYTYPRWSAKLPNEVEVAVDRLKVVNSLTPLQKLERTEKIVESKVAKDPIVVSADDRSAENMMRAPNPLPIETVKKNNLDLEAVRQQEKSMKEIIGLMNAMPNFTPQEANPQ